MYLILWYLCIFLTKTLVSSELISLINENKLTCVVTEKTINSTIYLDPPTQNVNLKKISKNFNVFKWNKNEWRITSTTTFIIDKRWQDFKVIQNHSIEISIHKNKTREDYGFSVCAKENLTVQISNQTEKTLIIDDTGTSCKWSHFKIHISKEQLIITNHKNNQTFSVPLSDKVVMKTTTNTTLWKIHKLKSKEAKKSSTSLVIPFSGKLCILMFVHLKHNNILNITFESNGTPEKKVINKNENLGKWQHIQLETNSAEKANLSFSTSSNGSWEISNIELCDRTMEKYEATFHDKSEHYSCKILEVDDTSKPKHKSKISCNEKPGYVGIKCNISCKSIFRDEYSYCEKHKICDDDGQCTCAWGYDGDHCQTTCQKGFWGKNCKSACIENCSNCNHVTGKCSSCKQGFWDQKCNKECNSNCVNSCNFIDGKCFGCRKGFWGERCTEECNINCNENKNCKQATGQCSGCQKGFWGGNCTLPCYKNCINCNQWNRKCSSCKQGFWDQKCDKKCNSNCVNSCNFLDGKCSGCRKGFWGERCTEKCNINCNENKDCKQATGQCSGCQKGFWGGNCILRCYENCINCNQWNRKCSSCKQGFWDQKCDKECNSNCVNSCNFLDGKCSGCRKGFWGERCTEECNINCNENKDCKQATGQCSGCKVGFWGKNCTLACNEKCISSCEQLTGKCSDCTKGFWGPHCEQKCTDCDRCDYETGKCFRQVTNLNVYCRSKTKLWVRWKPPNPRPDDYRLNLNANEKIPCRLWENFICTTIPYLEEDKEYKISVSPIYSTNPNNIGQPLVIKAFTNESVSDPPENLKLKYITNVTVLTWENPFFINGPLKEFHIQINGNNKRYFHIKPITQYEKIYNYSISVDMDVEYTINVWAINKFIGKNATIKAMIIGPRPKLSHRPFIQICTKTCTLMVPKPDGINKKSKFHFWVVKNSDDFNTEILKNTSNQNEHRWLINNITEDEDTFQLEIGEVHGKAVNLKNNTYLMYLAIDQNETWTIFPLYEEILCSNSPLLILIGLLVLCISLLSYILYAFLYKKFPFNGTIKIKRFRNSEMILRNEFSEHYKINNIRNIRKKLKTPKMEEMELLMTPPNEFSKPISINTFEKYLTDSINNDPKENELTKQYEIIHKNSPKPSNSDLLKGGLIKNRYNNVIPFDSTRVILRGNKNDDYINANYVDGYDTPKAFIATQAPMETTLLDFWWMIWQEKVTTIIMLTELVESETVKCEKYWPEPTSEYTIYGKILVKNLSEKFFSDYVYRKLEARNGNQTRVILHFQYTTWPDHGVPLYPQNFTPFVKKILAIPQNETPLVVHCNAGCGRTGTFILCDIILRMASKEKQVDFMKVLTKMRQQRVFLINQPDQYVFAHLVVSECLFGKDFSIPINNNFQNEVDNTLRKITVKPLLEHLEKVMGQFHQRQVTLNQNLSDECKAKNRFSTILPGHAQVFLRVTSKQHSSYINAVTVDCYRCPKKFIVTQQPLPNTIEDFWRLIKDSEINTIVSLNTIEDDSNCPRFWPLDDNNIEFPSMTLEFLEESDEKAYSIIKIKINITKGKSKEKVVNIINMKNWKRQTPKPIKIKDLITVWKEMFTNSWKGDSQIIITCYDGATASGLFVALAYLLEKIKYEQICDVFSAVRTVKQSRDKFVEDWAQLEFLYKAAVVYVEEFDNYDNFNN